MNQLPLTLLNDVQAEIGSLMLGEYDVITVVLSIMIAAMAAYAAIEMLSDPPSAPQRFHRLKLIGGAITFGFGVWSMHFVGMLAFRLPVPIYYDVTTSLLSIVPAWIGSGVAFQLIDRERVGGAALVVASVFIGFAISSMHYIGMAAMRLPATMQYHLMLFIASISVAIAAAYTALRLIQYLRSRSESSLFVKQMAALLLGVGVAAMHYVGMAAVEFRWADLNVDEASGISLAGLDWLFALIAIVFFSVVLIFGARDPYSERGMSLSAKTAVIAALLVAASATGVGFVAHDYLGGILLEEKIEEQGEAVGGDIHKLSTMMKALEEDVRFFSQLP